jgi:hypothetical protein
MPELIFNSCFDLTIRNKEIEADFQNLRDKRILFLNLKIIIFSFVSSLATMIFQYFYYKECEQLQFYKFNVIMCSITSGLYLIFISFCFVYKNIKVFRWINYIIFYLQIFVIIAFRFMIFRVANMSSILLFVEYLIETIVRLTWVVFLIHSFLESIILNMMSLITVWIIIPLLIPEDFYKDEMVNTLNYSFVIFSVVIIAYFLERQKKEAFYFNWKSDKRAKRLTNILENLNSGFVSFKRDKITLINPYFKKILKFFNSKQDKNKEIDPYFYNQASESKKIFLIIF